MEMTKTTLIGTEILRKEFELIYENGYQARGILKLIV
jgi:hypothetical protein